MGHEPHPCSKRLRGKSTALLVLPVLTPGVLLLAGGGALNRGERHKVLKVFDPPIKRIDLMIEEEAHPDYPNKQPDAHHQSPLRERIELGGLLDPAKSYSRFPCCVVQAL